MDDPLGSTPYGKPSFEIREAVLEDAQKITDLENAIFKENLTTEACKLYLLPGQKHDAINFVAVKGEGDIVGYIMSTVFNSYLCVQIESFAVKEEHRNMGIGTALLEAIIVKSIENGMTCIMLATNIDNRSIKLYESLNFEILGTKQNYYNRTKSPWIEEWGVSEDAYVMCNYL